MKKALKTVICSIISCAIVLSAAACGGKVIVGIDTNKTQIYCYAVEGGLGKGWLETAAADFNAQHELGEEYQVIVVPTSNENYELMLSSNGGDAHMYLTATSSVSRLVNSNSLADISSIFELDVDGKGITLGEKLDNSQKYQKLFSTYEKSGCYGLPIALTPMHILFDYGLFQENGWLIYQRDANDNILRDEQGNPKLSAGHDNKEGTYDDGQPVNIEEWEEMLGKISASNNTRAFIYTTKYDFYLEPILTSLIAQYAGYDAYISSVNGFGSYIDANGNTVDVELSKGYEMFDMPAYEKAIQFLADYMIKEEYVHSKSWNTTETSHKDAQQIFITGYQDKVELAAMLIEGGYWENESRGYFNLLDSRGELNRGYGDREYRYMLLPKLDGQQSDISFMTALDSAGIVVSNDKNKDLVEAAKQFLAFTCKDKYLQLFTLDSGAKRPFSYSLDNQQFSKLTPFQRNTFEMLSDTENIKILSEVDAVLTDPVKNGQIEFLTSAYNYTAFIKGAVYQRPLAALRTSSAKEYASGIRYFKENTIWASAIIKD